MSEDREYTDSPEYHGGEPDYHGQRDEGDDVEAHAAAAAAFNEPDETVDATEEPPDVEGHTTHPNVQP